MYSIHYTCIAYIIYTIYSSIIILITNDLHLIPRFINKFELYEQVLIKFKFVFKF